jgi:hypothetical protein
MMTANRMFSSNSLSANGLEGSMTTIVGARPPTTAKRLREVPRGLEVLVKKASIDPGFRARLLRERSKASGAISLNLDDTEALILDSLPEKNLEIMIDHAEVPHFQRKAFLGCIAAAMLAAIGLVDTAAEEIVVTGILPDRPGVKPTISWQGSKEVSYDIYTSDDAKSWTFLATYEGTDGVISYTDQQANWAGLAKRFYKIMARPLTRGVSTETPIKLEIKCDRVE